MRLRAAQIVVLVIAVGAGAIAAWYAGRDHRPTPAPAAPVAQLKTTDVLIAAADIGTGKTLSAKDLRWEAWPDAAAGSNFVRKSDRPNAIDELAGSIARAQFFSGEPIHASKLIKAKVVEVSPGYMAAVLRHDKRAISVDIAPETGASGFILPNDHVDVILTREDKVAQKTAGVEVITSETILENVPVLAIGQTVDVKDGKDVVDGKQVTLELDKHQAETLALSRRLGTITLALRSLEDFESKDTPEVATEDRPETDDGGRQHGINIIRYGVSSFVQLGTDVVPTTRTLSPAQPGGAPLMKRH